MIPEGTVLGIAGDNSGWEQQYMSQVAQHRASSSAVPMGQLEAQLYAQQEAEFSGANTVLVSQPVPVSSSSAQQPPVPVPMVWTTGLFDCCDDMDTCCYGFWCLPCLFGQNVEALDGSNCGLCCSAFVLVSQLMGAACFLSAPKRTKLRQAYALPPTDLGCGCGDEFEDYLVHCLPCTVSCAICQEARELRLRGAAAHCPAVPRHGAAGQVGSFVVPVARQPQRVELAGYPMGPPVAVSSMEPGSFFPMGQVVGTPVAMHAATPGYPGAAPPALVPY